MTSLVAQEREARTYDTRRAATHVAVSVFGALAGLAGVEHGVGEFLQGWGAPASVVIESWPDTAGFEVVSGEPAMTLIPNMALSGLLTIVVAVSLVAWAVWFIDRARGGLVMIGLSILLLLVGGGFGPPLIGIIVGATATRIGRSGTGRPGPVRTVLARSWAWLMGVGVAAYLALVPGMVLLSRFSGFDDPVLVSALMVLSFGGLILSLVAARSRDQLNN